FAVHCRGNMGCADSMWSIPTAVSLIDRGDADLDEFSQQLAARHNLFTEEHGGHRFTMFPLGTSILAAPAIPVLRTIARAAFSIRPSPRPELERIQYYRGCPPLAGEPVIALHSWSELIVASAVVAATTMLIFAIARLELQPSSAAIVALI